jgi:hypothetical protein
MANEPTPQSVDVDKLLKLVEQECTAEAVRDLLRKAKKADEQVRVSEANKSAIIQRNLREALDRRSIEYDQVYSLLCAAEENGSQHIFYYRTTTEQAETLYNEPERVATALFGPMWRETVGVPQFHLEPIDTVWSHFRIEHREGGHMTWTAKLYSGLERRDFIREEEKEGNLVLRVYEKRLSREVYLVRWHSWGLLELRVPRSGSRKVVLEWLGVLWSAIQAAIKPEDFEPWQLHEVCLNLIKRRVPNKGRYRLGNARMMDQQTGIAEFTPPSNEEDLCSDPARDQAVRLYHECHELGVYWLEQTNTPGPQVELRTIIGKCKPNDVLIAAKTTAEAVDYVTYRLREFAV